MRILVEAATEAELRWAASLGIADGAYLTPAALDADAYGVPLAAAVEALLHAQPGPCYATVEAVAVDVLMRDARTLARLGDPVIPVLPAVEDGLAALHQLAVEGIRAAARLVHAPGQALLAARAGAHAVFVTADLVAAHGGDVVATVATTRRLFDRGSVACDLLVAVSHAPPTLAVDALAAGADGVSLRPEAVRHLLTHPLADRSVDEFLRELTRRPRVARGAP